MLCPQFVPYMWNCSVAPSGEARMAFSRSTPVSPCWAQAERHHLCEWEGEGSSSCSPDHCTITEYLGPDIHSPWSSALRGGWGCRRAVDTASENPCSQLDLQNTRECPPWRVFHSFLRSTKSRNIPACVCWDVHYNAFMFLWHPRVFIAEGTRLRDTGG